MRDLVKDLVAVCIEALDLQGPVHEFGSYQEANQEGYADLRPMFEGKEYVGSDIRPGPGVDKILDLHSLELDDATVQTALVLDTIEHVEYPRKAMEEVHRVLKSGGVCIVTSHMNFYVHNAPVDYWRFTPDGMRSLTKCFESVMILQAGRDIFPHTVAAVCIKGAVSVDVNTRVWNALREWEQRSFTWEW